MRDYYTLKVLRCLDVKTKVIILRNRCQTAFWRIRFTNSSQNKWIDVPFFTSSFEQLYDWKKKRDSYHSGKYLIFPLKCTLVLQVTMPSPARSVTRSLSKETKPRAGQRGKEWGARRLHLASTAASWGEGEAQCSSRRPSGRWEPLLTRQPLLPQMGGGDASPPPQSLH